MKKSLKLPEYSGSSAILFNFRIVALYVIPYNQGCLPTALFEGSISLAILLVVLCSLSAFQECQVILRSGCPLYHSSFPGKKYIAEIKVRNAFYSDYLIEKDKLKALEDTKNSEGLDGAFYVCFYGGTQAYRCSSQHPLASAPAALHEPTSEHPVYPC